MNKTKLDKFKKRLLELKTQVLNSGLLLTKDDLEIDRNDLFDETDLANSIINQELNINMKQRELNKLRSIEAALRRVEEGDFGFCEDCDEPINEKRLFNQPWTTLCITHAEEREREQRSQARAL